MILYSVGPGPGAHAAPEIAREILRAGRPVEVVLEPGAQSYVGPAAFEGPIVEQPSEPPEVILFAPATPGTLARLARGLSQLAGRSFVAPDLDAATAEHPAVKENLALLRADGCRIVASRGAAGMAPAREVVARLLKDLGGPMSGLKVLVTAGGTREPIDSVRFIGNRSSGRMGLAVAREALRLGAEVSVVAANVEGREPGTEWAAVETVEELRAEVLRRAGEADALVMAAAVSDYAPDSSVSGKIRRQEEGGLSLKLKATPDILKAVRERYPDLFVVGFAATHGDPVPDAREKLGSKRANLVVGNDVSREDIGFGTDENEVYVVGRGGERFVPRASKESVARAVLESLLEEMRRQG